MFRYKRQGYMMSKIIEALIFLTKEGARVNVNKSEL